MKQITDGKNKLTHNDTLQLMKYDSGMVKEAMDKIFIESTFHDQMPITGVIKKRK